MTTLVGFWIGQNHCQYIVRFWGRFFSKRSLHICPRSILYGFLALTGEFVPLPLIVMPEFGAWHFQPELAEERGIVLVSTVKLISLVSEDCCYSRSLNDDLRCADSNNCVVEKRLMGHGE